MKYCDYCNKTSDDYSDSQGFRRGPSQKLNALDTKFNNEKDLSQRFYKMLRELENRYYV